LILSLVSAEKTIHLLSHDSPWPPQEATALDPAAPLRDVTSGAVFAPGKTTMIVPAEPQDGAALPTAWVDTFPRSSPSPWTRSRNSPARQPGPPGSRAPQRGAPPTNRTLTGQFAHGEWNSAGSTSPQLLSGTSAERSSSTMPSRQFSPVPFIGRSTPREPSPARGPERRSRRPPRRTSTNPCPVDGKECRKNVAVASPAGNANDSCWLAQIGRAHV